MYYVGIDLHKRTLVIAVEVSKRPVGRVCSFACYEVAVIREYMGIYTHSEADEDLL